MVVKTKTPSARPPAGYDPVDYEQPDFTKNSETYDLVFDAVGEHSFRRCRRSIAPGGLYIATGGFHNVAWALWTSVFGRRKARLGIVRYAKEDVLAPERLLAAGEHRPVIDRTYQLEDVVGRTVTSRRASRPETSCCR
jgi:NADPH:quinone reductase-like Zn-dependent oxidoreductase